MVVECLEPYPIHIDELIRKIALAPGKLQGILLQLELKEIIHQSEGNYFSLAGKG